jgi:hypothetical protein
MTKGMVEGEIDCAKKDKEYEIRMLPEDLWNIFVCFCLEKGYGAIERTGA